MASRVKEDEKNERIIRGLLKLTPNRKCINCNTLGSQYVCTTFSTFVCTTCAGIHREFSHRIKSVSMAKFTPQEVTSLQDGGNERAREIYFKEWDPQRQSAPNSSNVTRLRDFIKHVYVDRRYSGERSSDRSPEVKLGGKEEPNENRRSDASRSPSVDDTYERRYSARSSPGYDVPKSPGYDQGNQRHSDYGRSPVHSGVVSDWRREDRFSNANKSEDRRSSDGESIKSPDNQKDSNISSPPVVRPVREILGDNVIPLRISEPPKANNIKRAESSSSVASSNGDPTEPRRETSLIDFDAKPEPSLAASTAIQAPVSTPSPLATQPSAPPSDDNWACFDDFAETKVSEVPPSSNSLESVLTQLPATAPTQAGSVNTASNGLFYSGDASGSRGLPPTLPATGVSQWPSMQHEQPPSAHGVVNQSGTSGLTTTFPSGPDSQAPLTTPNPTQVVEAIPSGRKELPADIFTAMYSSSPYQAPGWQGRPVPGMGYQMYHPSMQRQQHQQYPMYHPAMVGQSMPTYPQPSQPSNPFDVNVEASVARPPGFPSMSSLHTALPNVTGPRGLVGTPNVGNPTQTWMPHQPQQPSYSSTLQQFPSFGSTMPGTYMGQQLPSNMAPPSRPHGYGGFGSEGGAFGSSPSPSLSGNPFG